MRFLVSACTLGVIYLGQLQGGNLDSVIRAYAKVQGYQVEAAVTNHITGNTANLATIPVPGPAEESLAVAYSAPGLWRIWSSTGPTRVFRDKRDYSLLKNGSAGLATVADPKFRDSQLTGEGFTNYTALKDDLSSVSSRGSEDVVADGVPVPCNVLEAKYSEPKGPWNASHWRRGPAQYWVKKRTLWVDTARDVVLREMDLIDGQNETGERATFERSIAVQHLEWDQRPADSLFDVGAPSGTVRPDGSVTPLPNGMPPLAPAVDTCKNVKDPWTRSQCVHMAQMKECRNLPITPEVKAAGLGGGVTIAYSVNPDGKPVDFVVKQGLGLGLDEEVVECIAQWRYNPFNKDGANPHTSLTFGPIGAYSSQSFWHLSHVEFETPNGASRPIFLEATYPAAVVSQRVTGFSLFRLQLVIGKDGRPYDIQVTPPVDPKLDKTAIEIVAKWRFRPGTEDGQPVDIPAKFQLGLGSDGQMGLPK